MAFELSRITTNRQKDGQTYQSIPLNNEASSNPSYPALSSKKNDDEPIPHEQLKSTPPTSDSPHSTAPVLHYCSFCERNVSTVVELQPSFSSFFVSIIMFLTCGWIAFCVIPFLWPLLQTVVHYCPLCHDVLEKRSRMSCVKLRDEVITLRVGSCALVLSRTYVIVCIIMLTLIMSVMGFRWYLSVFGLPDIPKGEVSDMTWAEFLQDCGGRSYLGNPVKAEKLFQDHYLDKTVIWQGRMHHIQEGIFSKHFMYLDMEPRQYQRSDLRDVALIFGKPLVPKIMELDVGDLLSAEMTLLELGKRGRPNLGVLWDFNVTKKATDLPPLEQPRNHFIALRDQFGRPPVNILAVIRTIRNSEQSLREHQGFGEDMNVILPFGAAEPSSQLIEKIPSKSTNKAGDNSLLDEHDFHTEGGTVEREDEASNRDSSIDSSNKYIPDGNHEGQNKNHQNQDNNDSYGVGDSIAKP